ncbi:DUF3987 domain-containing protein [Leucothrix sargassi]|nr:DUF3987 domain-containing protein [Leucothrix sargassi]
MNNLAITTNTNKAFHEFIKGQPTASYETYQHNPALVNLAHCIGKDKLLFIDSNITVDNTEQPTANSIGVMLFDEHYQPSNLAIFPLNNTEPFPLHGLKNDCFILGNGGQVVAVASLDTAIELYPYLTVNGEYSLIAPLKDWQFERMVKAHASHSQVTLFTDYPTGKQLETTFKGHNVRLVATVDTITDLVISYSLDEIINDSNKEPALQTKVKELNGIEWGEPEPLEDTNTPATRYPIEAWQGVLRQAVEAIAYHAQVSTAMAGQCVLGALATMLQQYINASFSDGEAIPVSLFLLTRGASSDGKNRTVRLSHRVIKAYQRELDEKYREDLEIWQADKRATPRKELDNFLITNPQPIQKTLFVTRGTLQGIINEMLNNQQKSIAWVTSDAGQFFGGYSMDDKNGSKTISDLSDVWSEGNFDDITKGNLGNKRAYDLRFTLDLQGQDEIIRKPLADPIMNGQGFLPRFLFAFPDSMRGKRVYNTPDRMNNISEHDPRLQAYWQTCRLLLDPLPSTKQTDEKSNPVKINMTFADQHARQALADYQQYCENRTAKGDKLEKYPAYAGRQAENASRIASLMAYFEGRTALTVDDIKRASLLTEYSIAERLRYDGESISGDSAENDSQKLVNWLADKAKQKQVNKLNWSYIYHGCPKPMNKNSKFIKAVIEILESANYVRMEKEGRAIFIYLNPILLR